MPPAQRAAMIADLDRATFSNIESQSIEFWTDTMLPWAECWESSIERFLLGAYPQAAVPVAGRSGRITPYYRTNSQSSAAIPLFAIF
jgi:phage portal protein BeeE